MDDLERNAPLALAFGVLLIAGCSDTPTQPGTPTGQETAPEFAVAANTWVTRADLPSTERYGLATAVVPNASGQSILYTIGGATGINARTTGGTLSKVQAYNAATNTWSYKASLPIPLAYTNGAGVINGKIYVTGGLTSYRNYRAETFMYDPATNTWTRKRDMPGYTWGGITGVINNKLYVLTCDGGDEDCYLDTVPLSLFRYDPATDQWTSLGLSPAQQGEPMGGVIGGKLYFTGDTGPNGTGARLTAYDAASNSWTSRTPLARPRWTGSGVALQGKLFVMGGFQRDQDRTVRLVRTTSVYDPTTDSWINKAALPKSFRSPGANRVFVNSQPRIEVVGGPRPGNHVQYVP